MRCGERLGLTPSPYPRAFEIDKRRGLRLGSGDSGIAPSPAYPSQVRRFAERSGLKGSGTGPGGILWQRRRPCLRQNAHSQARVTTHKIPFASQSGEHYLVPQERKSRGGPLRDTSHDRSFRSRCPEFLAQDSDKRHQNLRRRGTCFLRGLECPEA